MVAKMNRSQAGRRGGQSTVQKYGPSFFAEIGQKGGTAVSRNREHMSSIGRKGGKARRQRSI